jgi:hypothetical protein
MRRQVSEIGERLRMGHLVLGRASVVHLKRCRRVSDEKGRAVFVRAYVKLADCGLSCGHTQSPGPSLKAFLQKQVPDRAELHLEWSLASMRNTHPFEQINSFEHKILPTK